MTIWWFSLVCSWFSGDNSFSLQPRVWRIISTCVCHIHDTRCYIPILSWSPGSDCVVCVWRNSYLCSKAFYLGRAALQSHSLSHSVTCAVISHSVCRVLRACDLVCLSSTAGVALTFSGRYKRSDWRFCACAINVKSSMCSETTKNFPYKCHGLFVYCEEFLKMSFNAIKY